MPNPYGKPGTFWNCHNPDCSHVEHPSGLPCSSAIDEDDDGPLDLAAAFKEEEDGN
jgi:hypothetical protein